jgi:2-keto-4-pentenoate hydratase
MPGNTEPNNTLVAHSLQQAADALWNARQTRHPIAPLRNFISGDDLASAYAVQALNNRRLEAAGARRIGRKIGLTSKAVQVQLGVDQPDFGLLYDSMLYAGPAAKFPLSTALQPKIEGEIAFIVAADITEAQLPRDELRRRAGAAVAAFEIVDSAIADCKITLADTVADNASCGAIVVGQQQRLLSEFDTRLCGMVLTADNEIVSLGVGAASLGDPLAAFAWLAELAIKQGDPIRKGEVVLTGALGPMVPLVKGKHYKLEIAGFAPLQVVAE